MKTDGSIPFTPTEPSSVVIKSLFALMSSIPYVPDLKHAKKSKEFSGKVDAKPATGATPIPPPIIATFSDESGAENPFPKGPVIETVFPASSSQSSFVPFPRSIIKKWIFSLPSLLSIL